MKVIIVEDEPRVRKGLSEAVDWESLGMTLSGTAANGLEGLELFRQHTPDLVIADIRMPVMDGLAMTEAIMEQRSDIKIIIISGHDEFEYAQRCITLGVDNYLLKPIGRRELQAELEKIKQEWQSGLILREQALQFERRFRQHLQELRSVFLEEWLGGTGSKSPSALRESLSFLQIPLDFESYAGAAIFELDMEAEASYTSGDRNLLEFAMHNLLEEMLRHNGVAYQRGNGQTVVLFQSVSTGNTGDLLHWMERAKYKVGQLLGKDMTAALGSRLVPVGELPLMFQEAQRILGLKLSLGTGMILQESMIRPVREQLAVLHESQEAILIHGVEMNDPQEIRRVLEEHFDKWRGSGELAFAEEIFFQFTGLFTKLAHRLGRSVRDYVDGEDLRLWRNPGQFRSVADIREWWAKRFCDLSESYEGFRTDRKTKLVQQVIQYVEENIYDNITREEAANYVYINSSYLSRLFKEVTGESFSTYVLNKKMDIAIHLLQVERVMVYEVADRLGYKDPSYFARVFRKHTGKSPSDYQ